MAAIKQKASSVSILHTKTKKKRPGIHSKKKASNLKSSKSYLKTYKGQGK